MRGVASGYSIEDGAQGVEREGKRREKKKEEQRGSLGRREYTSKGYQNCIHHSVTRHVLIHFYMY